MSISRRLEVEDMFYPGGQIYIIIEITVFISIVESMMLGARLSCCIRLESSGNSSIIRVMLIFRSTFF